MISYYPPMPTKNWWVPNKIFLYLAIGWTLVIALLCLISFDHLPDVGRRIPNADKYVHFTFHFGFTILWFLHLHSKKPKFRYFTVVVIAVLMSVLYGASIEFLQEDFTNTRKADLKDILANFLGSFTAAMIAIGFRNQITKVLFNK